MDVVKNPPHYDGDGEVDCKRAIRSMMAGYDRFDVPSETAWWLGNAVKYIWRFAGKNGTQDLEKAVECIKNAIEKEEM